LVVVVVGGGGTTMGGLYMVAGCGCGGTGNLGTMAGVTAAAAA